MGHGTASVHLLSGNNNKFPENLTDNHAHDVPHATTLQSQLHSKRETTEGNVVVVTLVHSNSPVARVVGEIIRRPLVSARHGQTQLTLLSSITRLLRLLAARRRAGGSGERRLSCSGTERDVGRGAAGRLDGAFPCWISQRANPAKLWGRGWRTVGVVGWSGSGVEGDSEALP